jgi:hypothetical protein
MAACGGVVETLLFFPAKKNAVLFLKKRKDSAVLRGRGFSGDSEKGAAEQSALAGEPWHAAYGVRPVCLILIRASAVRHRWPPRRTEEKETVHTGSILPAATEDKYYENMLKRCTYVLLHAMIAMCRKIRKGYGDMDVSCVVP